MVQLYTQEEEVIIVQRALHMILFRHSLHKQAGFRKYDVSPLAYIGSSTMHSKPSAHIESIWAHSHCLYVIFRAFVGFEGCVRLKYRFG